MKPWLLLLSLLAPGCGPGEGVRCNPLLFQDECGKAKCTIPAGCIESYCCSPGSLDPNCQSCGSDLGADLAETD